MVTHEQTKLANPESGLSCGLAAPVPWAVQGSFGSERGGIKAPTFILTDCSSNFQVITGLILQQPHKAVTLIRSWDIWGNWGPDSKGIAESTQLIKGGVRLSFQAWSCCGVFRDRIKWIWGPWGQSRALCIRSGKLEAWEFKGPDKWVLTLETLESLINLWLAFPKILE